jgi:predicted regulator of Ras-like GTPase activity (Roadblock/LC7/MglB family)
LESLLSQRDADCEAHDGQLACDDQLTFSLEELMPELSKVDASAAGQTAHWRAPGEALMPLESISGFQAAALISADGEVIAAYLRSPALEPTVLGVYLAAVLESSSRAVSSTLLGAVDYVLIDCSEGALVARWVDEARHHLVVVLIDGQGQIGGAKYRIDASLPMLLRILEQTRSQ